MLVKRIWTLAVALLAAGPLLALQVYEVDTTVDGLLSACTAAPGDCSLRGAITAANNDGDDSQIILADEIYQLTSPGADEEFNASGDLDVRASVEILAAADASPVIEQTVADRVLDVQVSGGTFRMVGPITITGGQVVGLATGGGIQDFLSGTFELEDVVLMGNQAVSDGGCLAYGGGSGTNLSLHRVTLTDCHSETNGGGARVILAGATAQATITSSLVEGNTAYKRGGGLSVVSGGSVVILDTTIRGNLAGHQSSSEGRGGGLYLSVDSGVLRQSTVSDNQAGVPTTTNAVGGGVAVEGTSSFLAENSTISGNRTDGTNQKGAGLRVSSASATLDHTSVVDSPTQGMDAISYFDPGGTSLTLKNSIIDGGCSGNINSIVSSGFNVERPWNGSTVTTCNLNNPSDLQVTDLMLWPLAGYGGPTYTHGLLPGSPAQSLVSSAQCQSEDQRHAVRQGLFCDSGAYDDSSTPPGPWIFEDGVESGDTLAWSSTVP